MNEVGKLFFGLRESVEQAEEKVRLGELLDKVKYFECIDYTAIVCFCEGFLQNSIPDLQREARIIRAYCITKNKLYVDYSQALLQDLEFLKIDKAPVYKEIAKTLLVSQKASDLSRLISSLHKISDAYLDKQLKSNAAIAIISKLNEKIPVVEKKSLLNSYLESNFSQLKIVETGLSILMRVDKIKNCSELGDDLLISIQSKTSNEDLKSLPLMSSIQGLKLDFVWEFSVAKPVFSNHNISFENLTESQFKSLEKELTWIKNNNHPHLIKISSLTATKIGKKISVDTEEIKPLIEELYQRRQEREYFTLSEYSMITSQIKSIKQLLQSKSLKQKLHCKDFVIVKPCTIKLYRVDLHGSEIDESLLESQFRFLDKLNY